MYLKIKIFILISIKLKSI